MTTVRFRVASGRVVRAVALRHGLWWGVAMCVAVAVCAVLALTVDVRFWAAALMVVCLVVPMAGAFLYFWHAMREVTAINVIDHTVALGPDGLTLTVYPRRVRPDTGDTLTPGRIRALAGGDTDDGERLPAERILRYGLDELDGYVAGLDEIWVPVRRGGKPCGMLLIPAEAFGGRGDGLARFTAILAGRVRPTADI